MLRIISPHGNCLCDHKRRRIRVKYKNYLYKKGDKEYTGGQCVYDYKWKRKLDLSTVVLTFTCRPKKTTQ